MIEMAVADDHGPHGWQRTVGSTRIETEVELRQEYEGALTGARPSDQT
jgi:hypothetical protein